MRLVAFVFFLLGLSVAAWADDTAWLSPVIGDGYGVQVKEGRTSDKELEKIKAAGLSYVRFVLPWGEVEKGQGSFVWGYFETFIKRLREHGLKAVIVLGGGHPNYTGFIQAPEDNLDQTDRYLMAPDSPVAVESFARYAAKTVSHFDGQDIIWEIWNEPDSDRFWAPKADAQAYSRLAEAACLAMRKASPNAHIIGPATAEMAGQWGFVRVGFLGEVLRSPAAQCFDALSMHPYRDGEKPPEKVLKAYDRFYAFVRHFAPKGSKKWPVMATEWGFTLTDTSEEEQAAFLLRSFLLNSLSGVPVSIWYEWRDARSGEDDPEAHFGLLTLQGKEKVAYRALQDFLPPLKGARIEERVSLGQEDDFLLKIKRVNGRKSLVFWTAREKLDSKIVVRGCSKDKDGQEWGLTPMPQRVDCDGGLPAFTVQRVQRVP
ncbi:MAG: cellulase family glycosylhydrolase [Bdellovibrionales bacterium]|jgi:hypothetical protein